LFGDDEPCDEEGIGLQYSTQHTTCFEVETCVRRCDGEELIAKLGWEENGTKGVAILEKRRRLKCELVEFGGRSQRSLVGYLAW
jgi:hypothetical protein